MSLVIIKRHMWLNGPILGVFSLQGIWENGSLLRQLRGEVMGSETRYSSEGVLACEYFLLIRLQRLYLFFTKKNASSPM